MLCFPNAKINLGLHVVSKREDGYHNLETVFYPLKIYDALEVVPVQGLRKDEFYLSGLPVDGDGQNNLVMKALRLMRERHEFPPVEVRLVKKIPFGAGLGGGSADASFMLRLLNDSFELGETDEGLARLALGLGADCPFFVYNRPLLATGVGEVFEEVAVSLAGHYLVLVKPDVHVSTRDAFGGICPQMPDRALKEVISLPVEAWREVMRNDFEATVFAKYPEIAAAKARLYEMGAVYASMSGSGSAVFGIFREETPFKDALGACWRVEV